MTVAPDQRPSWLRGRLEDLRLSQWAKGVVAVLLGATALFGGLDRVDTGVTTVRPGERYDDGAVSVTVDRASVVSSVTAGDRVLRQPEPGSRYLAVVAEVSNDGSTDAPLTDELDLRGVPDARKAGAFRLADGTQSVRLGPGLQDRFGFVWQIPESALSAGDTVTVRIWKKQYKELSVTYGKGWVDSLTDYGQVEIPVQERS